MKISNIHEKWGSVIELDNPLDFFKFHKNYWRDLLYKRKLLIFKKMAFQPIDYAKFGHHFGRPWTYTEYFTSREKPVDIKEDNNRYAVSDFYNGLHSSSNPINTDTEMNLHADIPNDKNNPFPTRALWIVQKPQNNSGTTHWLNIEDCFDQLSPELKDLASRITVMQQSWHTYETGHGIHDFIKTHPVTGNKSLRLNYYATSKVRNAWIIKVYIDNVEQPDCSLIQTYINDLKQYKELYHSHTWDLYDIAIYDNYSFIHGRSPVIFEDNPENNKRRFYRINIKHLTDDEFQKIELPPFTSTSTIK